MANLSKFELFLALGFKSDPFKSVVFETGDSVRIRRIMDMAVKSNAIISIVGERGTGKTRAVNAALKALNARCVMVRSADKSKLLISDIENAMIIDLSEEKPKRGREIRARQLRRVLGEASRKQNIVVVIEEGHRIHGMTMRALKTLRELDWMGETELFSVVLLGQSDPMNKAGVAEVRLRSDSVSMHGLTANEVAAYIESTVGNIVDKESAEAVTRLPEARNFLDLQNILVRLMNQAITDGRKGVIIDDFAELFGGETQRQLGASKGGTHASGKNNAANEAKSGSSALQSVLSRRKSIEAGEGIREAV